MPSKQQSVTPSQKIQSSQDDMYPPGTLESNLQITWASQKVSLMTVSFMDAFCRRNLSVDEIAVVGVFIDAAFTNPDTTTHEYLNDLMRQISSVVKHAPRSAQGVTTKIEIEANDVK